MFLSSQPVASPAFSVDWSIGHIQFKASTPPTHTQTHAHPCLLCMCMDLMPDTLLPKGHLCFLSSPEAVEKYIKGVLESCFICVSTSLTHGFLMRGQSQQSDLVLITMSHPNPKPQVSRQKCTEFNLSFLGNIVKNRTGTINLTAH